MSGVKYTESGIGIYAGSQDSYYAFAPLLDKVIQDYHGHNKDDKHVSSINFDELICPPLPDDEDKMIKATRIRITRNYSCYPLGAIINRKDRIMVENFLTSATSEFKGELAGKYYSLPNMTDAERK